MSECLVLKQTVRSRVWVKRAARLNEFRGKSDPLFSMLLKKFLYFFNKLLFLVSFIPLKRKTRGIEEKRERIPTLY